MAGGAHGLLGGVAGAVQGDAHEAEHHVAAGPDGQIHVHPAGVAHGGVGDHHALEAPLIPEHVGEQGGVGAGPDSAQVVVAAHDGGGAALLDSDFKGTEVDLAHGLLVGPHGQGETVALLVVEGEMLDIAVHALAGGAPDGGGGQLAGEKAVLGVVLEVTAGERSAVDVGAGGVETHHVVGHGLRTEGAAEFLHQSLVPGGADDHLAGEGHATQVAHQAVDAGRAVQVVGGGLAHTGDLGGGPAAVGDHIGHVLHAQLLQKLLPHGVVVVLAGQVLQSEAVVGEGDGLVVRVVLIHRRVGEGSHHLVGGSLAVGAGGGQGAFPVGTGDVLGDLAVGHVVEAVDSGGHISGAGVALVIDGGGGHGVLPLVDDLVGVAHQLNLIGAGLQHIAAVGLVVVGGHVLGGKGDGDGLAVTGLEQLGLVEAGQHHVGLFNAAHGVGGGVVDLDHVLTGHAAGVGHLHGHGDGAVGVRVVLNFLGKGGVAQAVAEGVLDGGLVGLLVAQAGLVVDPAGLIEAVAHVDALGVLHVVALQVAVCKVACVPVGGGGGDVIGVGVSEAAGGVHHAGQGLAHGVHTGAAGAADPQGGVDAVILQEAQLHGVGGVDEHHHGLIALGLDQLQQVLFVLGEGEVAAAVVGVAVSGLVHVGGQVAALAADTGEHDHGHVGEVPGLLEHLIGVLGGGHLSGGEVGAGVTALLRTADAGIAVEVGQLLVDGKAGVGQALDQVHVGGRVAGAAAGAAVEGGDAGVAEQVDFGALLQGEGAVLVLQQHETFGLKLLGHQQAGFLGLLGGELLGGDIAAGEAAVQVGRHEGVDGGVQLDAHHVDNQRDDHQHADQDNRQLSRRAGGRRVLFFHIHAPSPFILPGHKIKNEKDSCFFHAHDVLYSTQCCISIIRFFENVVSKT